MVRNSKREGGPRRAVNTKVTDAIRTRLEKAAAANGQTLSAEIEYRLIRSFLEDKAYEFEDEMQKDEATKDLLNLFTAVLGTIYRYREKSWQEDQPSRDAVACAVGVVLQMSFEDAPLDLPPAGTEERSLLERQRLVARAQGRTIALGVMAPRVKDKSFQAFYDDLAARSGWVNPGPDPDAEEIIQAFEDFSNPKD